MYYFDGFVYGSEPKQNMEITDVKVLPDMIMILTFNNKEKRIFDASILDGMAFEPLKNEEVFNTAVLDHGVVTWLDGEIDCAPEYMYEHSYEYSTSDVAYY